MPGDKNILLTQHTTQQQINTFKQEQTNDYFMETQRFDERYDQLQQNKRYLLGFQRKDSRQMANVKQSLSELKTFLSTVMSSEPAAFDEERRRGYQLYERLALHCETYINAKGSPVTASGKSRLAMVKNIYRQCCNEKRLFNNCAQSLFQESGHQSVLWSNVLGEIRIAHINIDRLEITETGNCTSEVWKFRQGETTAFFKAEEKVPPMDMNAILDQYAAEYIQKDSHYKDFCNVIKARPELMMNSSAFLAPVRKEREAAQAALDRLRAENPAEHPDCISAANRLSAIEKLIDLFDSRSGSLSPAEELVMEEMIPKIKTVFANGRSVSLPFSPQELDYFSYAPYLTFYFQASKFATKQFALANNCFRGGINGNAVISTRNVATSRLASLLGFPGLIAKSRTVVLEKDGKQIPGNLMMEASGTEFHSLVTQAEKNGIAVEYTPEMIRQLTALQIIDTLCAQYDRNKTNYFADSHMENGRLIITGLTAIDNDIAFGELSYEHIKNGTSSLPAFEPKNQPGICSLPAISQNIFQSIMNLDPRFLDYTLGDLLSEAELKALKERLAGMQKVLADTSSANPDFVADEEHWPEAISRFAQVEHSYVMNQYVPRMENQTQAPNT